MFGFPNKTQEYDQLEVLKGPWGILYGPVMSRRWGKSLGINLLPTDKKVCSFNCGYCDLGPTEVRMGDIKKSIHFPTLDEVTQNLRNYLHGENKMNEFDVITLSGNGEPTLHPEFAEIVDEITKIIHDFAPEKKTVILTNGVALDQRRILQAVNKIDIKVLKLDAGNDISLKKINEPLVRVSATKLISAFRRVKKCEIQSLFVEGTVSNTSSEIVEEWIEAVSMVSPEKVTVTTINKVPAVSGLLPVSKDILEFIAAKLIRHSQVKIQVLV